MVALDFRTRTDAGIREVDTATFFDEELPALIAERAALAVAGAQELGVEPFTIITPSGSWTLALDGTRLHVARGEHGAACVELSDADIADVVNDLKTPMTFLTAGTLKMARGNLGDFLDWWVTIRSLIDGRPVHTRGAVTFEDRDGSPLDFTRAFTPDDDDEEIAAFLAEAGFLHLRGWLDADLMHDLSADMDRALPLQSREDGRSWWAKTANGEDRCVRMEWFQDHSALVCELLESERFLRIGNLSGCGHTARAEGNRIGALVKPIGVVEGISDVPWHKDCSLGMHSYRCCGLTCGISVTGADARSGQLRVVAGSHRALVQPAFVRSSSDLPIIDLPTDTGDVTVHASCTLHMSQPPIDRERRVMYTGFDLPALDAVGEHQQRAMAAIGAVRQAAYKTVSQAPGHTG
jgi:hypothetical protein